MGILNSARRRRVPPSQYITIDGGHPAPYPDMTDEQLYNYEMAFRVPHKTFDEPPVSKKTSEQSTVTLERTQPRTRAHTSNTMRTEPRLDSVPKQKKATQELLDFSRSPQLINYEIAFKIPRKILDNSPISKKAVEQPTVTREHTQSSSKSNSNPNTSSIMRTEPRLDPMPKQEILQAPLDFSQPIRTITTKQPVEIITTCARHPVFKVHGYIGNADVVTVFTLDGQISENGPRFLENAPRQPQIYLNVYLNCDPQSHERFVLTQHESKEEADVAKRAGRLACVPLQFAFG